MLLENPRREGYEGWDDSANRNRLLEAAGELEPDWIISLDADERIDADDAAAVREFVDSSPRPDVAYGLRVHRMIGDDEYDRADLWVYRLFAYNPPQEFPRDRLHHVPIPTSIPRSRWMRTTFRIQHFASVTEDRRRARFEKYAAADPLNAFQSDYTNVLAEPGHATSWEPREPDTPFLERAAEDDRLDLEGPVLSAIVISHNDEDTIEEAVRAVVEQQCPEPFEVIVVVSGDDRTAEVVRSEFPEVTLVELEGHVLPGVARNAGLRVARGDFISFPGSHVRLPPGSLAARIEAHDLGHAMVTGTTLNGNTSPAGWASYFLDHASVLPGRPSEELRGPPAHCSYREDLLRAVGGFPEDMRAGEDTVVNVALWRRGFGAYRARGVRLVHRSPCRTVTRLVRHHFNRGRGLGRILLQEHGSAWAYMARGRGVRFLLGYCRRRLGQTSRSVEAWGGPLRPVYRRVLPLVVLGIVAAWAGTLFELVRGSGARATPAPERPPSAEAVRGSVRPRTEQDRVAASSR